MPCVLLVEDQEDIQTWLTMCLQANLDVTVISAWDGLDAIRKLECVTPHAIVFDLLMPRMDGFEFRRRCLDDPRLAKIPALAITAIHDLAEAAEKLGTPVLSKTADSAVILAAIRALLN